MPGLEYAKAEPVPERTERKDLIYCAIQDLIIMLMWISDRRIFLRQKLRSFEPLQRVHESDRVTRSCTYAV